MSPLGLLRFRIGLYYPIKGEALMKEPKRNLLVIRLFFNQRIAPPDVIYIKFFIRFKLLT